MRLAKSLRIKKQERPLGVLTREKRKDGENYFTIAESREVAGIKMLNVLESRRRRMVGLTSPHACGPSPSDVGK